LRRHEVAVREIHTVVAFCCHEQQVALEFAAPLCRDCGLTPTYEPPLLFLD
jgi:hypothetical protein